MNSIGEEPNFDCYMSVPKPEFLEKYGEQSIFKFEEVIVSAHPGANLSSTDVDYVRTHNSILIDDHLLLAHARSNKEGYCLFAAHPILSVKSRKEVSIQVEVARIPIGHPQCDEGYLEVNDKTYFNITLFLARMRH